MKSIKPAIKITEDIIVGSTRYPEGTHRLYAVANTPWGLVDYCELYDPDDKPSKKRSRRFAARAELGVSKYLIAMINKRRKQMGLKLFSVTP